MRNTFAILAHEHPRSVEGMIKDIRISDPTSDVAIYDGSGRGIFADSGVNWGRMGVSLIPNARRLQWGELHEFAVATIEHVRSTSFDTMTFLDSDQLMVGCGYSSFLASRLPSNFGVATTEVVRHGPDSTRLAARDLHSEWYLWRSYLERFPNADEAFVRSTFWPGTIVSADAARDIALEFRTSILQNILQKSRAWATEECLIPTISYLLGYREILNPCDRRWCRFRTPWNIGDIEEALHSPEAFYIHPVDTDPENPLRRFIHDFMRR